MIELIKVINNSHCQCCGKRDLCGSFDVFDRIVYLCEDCIKKAWNMIMMERLKSINSKIPHTDPDKIEGCFQ